MPGFVTGTLQRSFGAVNISEEHTVENTGVYPIDMPQGVDIHDSDTLADCEGTQLEAATPISIDMPPYGSQGEDFSQDIGSRDRGAMAHEGRIAAERLDITLDADEFFWLSKCSFNQRTRSRALQIAKGKISPSMVGPEMCQLQSTAREMRRHREDGKRKL